MDRQDDNNANLSEEEQQQLKEMESAYEEMNATPISEAVHLDNQDKYNFPIGMDDSAELFPVDEK